MNLNKKISRLSPIMRKPIKAIEQEKVQNISLQLKVEKYLEATIEL